MESKERRLECPECKKLMPALLLSDLNKCDNCGCLAYLFDRD
jgi:ribosomal protein L37AE/L43A